MLDNELNLRRNLEAVSSEQLRVMLHAETEKEVPDDDLVLAILHILEDREPDDPEPMSAKEEAAWKLFRKRVRARKRTSYSGWRRLANVAMLLLVVGLLFAMVPQEAEADSWWDRITAWTDSFFSYFNNNTTEPRQEAYEFQTDNSGLQQVYDAVVEMGVTDPVVPMWLPEGYELTECTTTVAPTKSYVHARFLNDSRQCVLKVNALRAEGAKQYYKDETSIATLERYGTIFHVMKNQETWTVTWTKENIECAFSIDCAEDALHEVIGSIYRWRINE